MKNLSAYLDDFIQEEDGNYFEHCKGKISCGEVGLPMKESNLILPCGIYGRWEK
jgi:hypothetical protein